MSEKVDQIFPAIIAAQAEMENVHKDAKNPHFRSTYASLLGIRNMSKDVLTKHGLGIMVLPTSDESINIGVTMLILHASGQWLEERCFAKLPKTDAQAVGSFHSYMRRYGENGAFGIVADELDDDGNEASGLTTTQQQQAQKPSASSYAPQLDYRNSPLQQQASPAAAPQQQQAARSDFRPNPAKAGEPISEAQAKRLFAISKTRGWTVNELVEVLHKWLGVTSPKHVKRADYEQVCLMVSEKTYKEALAEIDFSNDGETRTPPPAGLPDIPPFSDADIPF